MVLVNAWDNLRESNDFKFYELRKIRLCEPLTNQSIQNIAISNNIIFVATTNALKVIVVPLVLEFEWTPRIQNQILDDYKYILIPLTIKPTYLTICGGKAGLLVVSGPLFSNPNQTQIQFFDITDLNAVNNQLQPFATIDLNPSQADIIGLDWHPEYNESLFVAVLSSGLLISVGINILKKQAKILSVLSQPEKITCACWSPRGKQFVIGKENGQIVQIKHKDGLNFEEAKKINADEELAGYEVNAIKWCFTQLFMVSYAKCKSETDFDVKHITIYAPPKLQPVFNNHTQLCIEQFRKDLKYKTDFVHLGSVILCSTSFSSEMGVLVCDDVEKSVHNWCQLMLVDENRLDLPMIKNNQSLSKGLALYTADTRIFKISETQTIGGKNCPLLMVISSEGILNNYYVSYPKLVCPTQLPTKQLEFQYVPSTQSSTVQQQHAPLNLQQQQQTQPQIKPQQSSTIVQQNNNSQHQQATNVTAQPLTNQQLQAIQQQDAIDQARQEKLIALQIQQQKAKEAEIQKEKERKQLIEENHAYLVAIKEEIGQFNGLIKECKTKYKDLDGHCLSIGIDNEKRVLIELTNGLEADLNDLKEKLKNIDIELLENFLLENFAMAEDARSRVERDNDSKLNILFKKKPLDPVTTRKLKEINQKTVYIETNLKEINYILDQQWQDYIQSEKKGVKHNTSSPVNLIYQTLTRNQRVLEWLENQLRNLDPHLPWKDINHKLNYKKQDVKKLTNSLKKSTISNNDTTNNLKLVDTNDENDVIDSKDDEDDLVEIHKMSKKNKMNLLRILDSRPEVPIKRSTLPIDMNSTIMISAVSKAKEKLKSCKKQYLTEIDQQQKLADQQQKLADQRSTLMHKAQIQHRQMLIQQQEDLIRSSGKSASLSTQQPQQQQQQQQQQQIKTTATFVPPVGQQTISSNKKQVPQSQQQTVINKTPTSSTVTKQQSPAKPLDQQQNNKISFGIIDQNKQQIASLQQQQQQIKDALSQISSATSSSTIFTPAAAATAVATSFQQPATLQSEKTEFTFKPDQLNLTFDKNNLNLLSSTPIKTTQQRQQAVDSTTTTTTNKTVSFNQPMNLPQLNKQPVESSDNVDANKQKFNTATVNKSVSEKQLENENLKLPTTEINLPRYEDISPATTPTIDNLSQQQKNAISQQATPSKQQSADQIPFSFNTLAALSKMPISTTFASSIASPNLFQTTTASSAAFPPSPFQATNNILSNLQKTTSSESNVTTAVVTTAAQTNFGQTPTKPLFGQPLTSTSTINVATTTTTNASSAILTTTIANQPSSVFTSSPSTSIFAPQPVAQKPPQNTFPVFGSSSQATTTSSFPSFGSTGFGIASNSQQQPSSNIVTTTTASSNNLIKTTASSIFGTNVTSTTASSGILNLSTTSPKTDSQSPQKSVLTSNQTSNIQTTSSAFSTTSSQSPFASTIASTQSSTTTATAQPAFGFSSMCSLGGKPNPENLSKNPFGGAISTPTTSNSLFGSSSTTTPQQQTLFGSPFSSPNPQVSQTLSTGTSFSSPFSTAGANASAFGSPPAFGSPMSKLPQTGGLFGNNGSSTTTPSILNKPTFGFQTQQPQQPTSPFAQQSQQQQQPQQTPFGQQSQFGAKPTFGMATSSGFGAPPTFGSPSKFGSPNISSAFNSPQPQKTGFESFANANVPTFGSFSAFSQAGAVQSTSFEGIAHNQTQQSPFNSPSPFGGSSNPQFGGSQFSERRA